MSSRNVFPERRRRPEQGLTRRCRRRPKARQRILSVWFSNGIPGKPAPTLRSMGSKKHGIDFHEAATVLDDTLSSTFPDTGHSSLLEPRFLTIGMSSRGRIVVVAHTEHDDTVRIISARRATRHERRFYEEG